MHDTIREKEVLLKYPGLIDEEGVRSVSNGQILPCPGAEDGTVEKIGTVTDRSRIYDMIIQKSLQLGRRHRLERLSHSLESRILRNKDGKILFRVGIICERTMWLRSTSAKMRWIVG